MLKQSSENIVRTPVPETRATAQPHDHSRRQLVKTALFCGVAAIVSGVPLTAFVIAPALEKKARKWIDFGPVADLEKGDFSMLSYEFMVKDGWVVLPQRGFIWARRDSADKIRLFSSTCSHLACNVIWEPQTGLFECPCHSGRFNAQGIPIAGPPTRPLAVPVHKVEEDMLLVAMDV